MRTLALMLPLALAFAQPPAPTEPIDPKKLATIEGTVVNSISGQPIRRVNITLRPSFIGVVQTGPMLPPSPLAATTNTEGKFKLERIEPGSYFLQAERQGLVTQQYGARTANSMGTPITLTAGQEMKELHFKLVPHAVLAGRVLDDEGEPLEKISVQIRRAMRIKGKQQLVHAGTAQTNDLGEFRAANLPPGRYWLSASISRHNQLFGEGAPRATTDQPQEEVVTTFFPSSTDEAGARPLDLVAGQTLSAIDIRMRKERVYRIKGKLVAPTPVKDIRVTIMPRDKDTFADPFNNPASAVNPDGSFEISKVLPGAYTLVALTVFGNIRSVGSTPINVARENLSGILIPFHNTITVTGSIRAETPDPALPLSFTTSQIFLNPVAGFSFNSTYGKVDAEGAFRVENAGPETYRVNLAGLSEGYWIKAIISGGQDILDSGIDLNSGPPEPIEIILGSGVGSLTGRINDDKDIPAAGASASLVPDPYKPNRPELNHSAPTDQNGNFKLTSIRPGNYKLYAWESFDYETIFDPENLKAHEASAKSVTIKPGSTEQLTLKSIPIPKP
jgi:hypothetical protein